MKDRLIAVGLGSIVGGYSDIEDVKVFVSEYQKTGKMGKNIPLPYVNFVNATEDFPEAQTMFASELAATKKMEAQIKSILEMITAENRQATAENRQATAELRKQIQFLDGILKGIK